MTRGEVFVITPAGTIRPEPVGGLSLERAQAIVGGYIEDVRSTLEGVRLIVNEDGRRLKLAPNPIASELAGLPLLGTVIALRYSDDDDFVALTVTDLAAIERIGGSEDR